MPEWKEAVGKWVLIRKKSLPLDSRIREVMVLQLSPSGRYAKIREEGFPSYEEWIDTSEYELLEVLY